MNTLQGKRPGQHLDAGNNNPGKRSKSDDLSFEDLLEECGCRISLVGDGSDYFVEDPRKLRRNLEQRLTLNEALRRTFLDAIRDHLEPPEVLHSALRPMTVTGTAAFVTGDSFVRILLNTPPLQRDLSEYLLQRIPEFSADALEGGGATTGAAGSTTRATATKAQLILGQFRWLDCLVDPHSLTASVLEVLPAMPPEAQHDAVTFLPEIAPEDDHPAVLDALESLVADGPEFLIPALEAASNLALNDAGQNRVTEMVASRPQSVDVQDLPAVVRHLVQSAGTSDTLSKVREALHFVSPGDPRLAVPDRKGKWRVPAPGEDPESRVLGAMKQALQFGKGAADAAVKFARGITAPDEHSTFDFWLMLAMAALGPERRRTVFALLRKKFAEKHAGPQWIERSVSGHAFALEEQFSLLLNLAQNLLSDTGPAVSAAGAALLVALFSDFSDAYCRQEVLRALHSHLGATVPAEATAALHVLQKLAHERTADLMQYAAFLTNILDYASKYNQEQLRAAFDVFAELVTGACQSTLAASGGATAAGVGSSSQSQPGCRGGGRSRMEDKLFIFLRKQLSGAFPEHRRVGAVGVVALVQRLGREMEEQGGGQDDTSLLAQRYREARALLDSTFTAAASCPDTLSFLCDALATEASQGTLPRALMGSLRDTLQDRLESLFIVDLPSWTATANREAWWNLSGSQGDVVCALMPPVGNSAGTAAAAGGAATLNTAPTAATGSSLGPGAGIMATIFPTLRAVTALNMAMVGNLQAIDALLGCPLGLFPMQNVSLKTFLTLEASSQRQVLLGLFFALNWCRELVNTFAPVAGGPVSGEGAAAGGGKWDPQGDRLRGQMQMGLMLRARAAGQLEAALSALLPAAPALMAALPSLGQTAPGIGSSAAAGKKASAAGGGGKKKGSKVKFEAGEGLGDKQGSGGKGGDSTGTAPQCSDHDTHSTGSARSGSGALGAGNPSAAANAQGQLFLAANERAKLRALVPSSILALHAISKVEGADGKICFSALPAAAYLLSDLVEKARASFAPPKKMPFLTPFGNKTGAAAEAIPASSLLAALYPALPALRDILDAANRVTESRTTDGDIQSDEEIILRDMMTANCTSPLLSVLPDCPAARRAASPNAAAPRVFSQVLECYRLLLSFYDITSQERRGMLQAVLSAFGPQNAASPGSVAPPGSGTSDASFVVSQWTTAQFVEGCTHAFKYFLQLAPAEGEEEGPTAAEMARWPAVLSVLEALLKLGEKLAQSETSDPTTASSCAKRLSKMRQRLSDSAGFMLQFRWPSLSTSIDFEHDDGAEEVRYEESPAGGWKGRSGPLSEAIRCSIIYAKEPLQQLEGYVTDGLLEITPVPTGKENSEPLEDWPSLSGATLGTWYKALWDILQARWKDVTAAAKSSGKAANIAAETAPAIMAEVSSCCAVFHVLVTVVKHHSRRAIVLNAAAKGGAVFIEGVLRVVPFFGEVFPHHREEVISTIKQVQKAARSLNCLCAEGKVRGDMNVVLRVSRLKKAIECFINESYLLLHHHAPELMVEFGELKHRDLQGNALENSQMFPAAEEEKEAEEEEVDDDEEDM